MKTKINAFVKKIKNWLSSLSKWAQKHKLKIFTIICSSFLLISSLVTCTNNKKSACAAIVGNLLYLPSVECALTDGSTPDSYGAVGRISSFFLELDSNGLPNLFYAPSNAYYSYSPLVPSLIDDSYYYIGNVPLYWTYLSGGSVTSSLIGNGYITITKADLSNLVSTAVALVKSADRGNYIEYSFWRNGEEICTLNLYLNNSAYITDPSNDYMFEFTPTYVGTPIDGLEDIYLTGFETGYSNGYITGYNDGISTRDLSGLSIITSAVGEFVNTNLFGNFSIGDLVSIGAGAMLFMYAIKMFLGG